MIEQTENRNLSRAAAWIGHHRWLLLILAVGLAGRLLFIALFPDWDENGIMDSARYRRVAENILAGRGFIEWRLPTAFAPPLFPYFIAGIIRLFGPAVMIVKFIQVILSLLTLIWVYIIGKDLFHRPVGLAAALATALNPEIIVMAGSLYTETLYIFLSTLAMMLLVRAMKKPPSHLVLWLASGCVFALAILTRHVILLFPAGLFLFAMLFRALRRHQVPVLFLMLTCFMTLVPWTLRHYVLFDRFVPVASGAGGGMWHGSYRSYDGQFQYGRSRQVVARETRGLENPIERDEALLKKSIGAIRENPPVFAWMVVKKFVRFFTRIYEDMPQGERRQNNPLILGFLALSYYPVLLLFVWGMAVYIKRWVHLYPLYLFILYNGLIYAVTLVIPRYRIPLLPFLMLFAAAGLMDLFSRLQRRHGTGHVQNDREGIYSV
ncbi:glycosyltransferase family 39 protein [bacterium]|nr:glycosyltransferase family 39 protein [bacterium]